MHLKTMSKTWKIVLHSEKPVKRTYKASFKIRRRRVRDSAEVLENTNAQGLTCGQSWLPRMQCSGYMFIICAQLSRHFVKGWFRISAPDLVRL